MVWLYILEQFRSKWFTFEEPLLAASWTKESILPQTGWSWSRLMLGQRKTARAIDEESKIVANSYSAVIGPKKPTSLVYVAWLTRDNWLYSVHHVLFIISISRIGYVWRDFLNYGIFWFKTFSFTMYCLFFVCWNKGWIFLYCNPLFFITTNPNWHHEILIDAAYRFWIIHPSSAPISS